jgi:chromosome segregation ATPase
MAITTEIIHQAANRIAERGEKPTQAKVRAELGGGSFTTISEAMKLWNDRRADEHELAEVQVPEVITERFDYLQGAIWNAAISEAERRLSTEREALKVAREQFASELAEANEAVILLESEQEDLKKQVSNSSEELQKIEAELVVYKDRIMNLRSDTVEALSKKTAEIESLKATVTELRKSLEKSEKRSESLESKLEQNQKEHQEETKTVRKDHKSEIDTIQGNHREALAAEAKKVESLESWNNKLATAKEHSEARLEAAQTEIEHHRSATAKMREKLESAQKEASELRGELKAINAQKEKSND